MQYDLVLKNGILVTPSASFRGDLAISEGKIAALSQEPLKAETSIDLKGQIVLPGVVDLHVHFSEPGRDYWEGWANGSRAAAFGGVTTVVEMPLNAIPATTNVAALKQKVSLAEEKSLVDFALWGGFVDNNLSELESLAKEGIIGFKAFMVDTRDTSFQFVEEDLLFEGMKEIARLGQFLAVHAEDNAMVWEKTQQLQKAGRKDRKAWLEARQPEMELKAIQKALRLAKETKCPLHIVHLSIPEAIDAIQAARAEGVKVSFETCPHYLCLTDQDFIDIGPEAKCAPPLRDKLRQDMLWQRVLAAQFDCISSDHSPCTFEEKSCGEQDIWAAWGGITGIQTLLPVMFSEAVIKRNMPLQQLAYLLSERPAQIAKLWPRKGRIGVGADADLVIVDPAVDWQVHQTWLKSKHPHSPFVTWQLKGKISQVFTAGNLLIDRDELVMQRRGQWLKGES